MFIYVHVLPAHTCTYIAVWHAHMNMYISLSTAEVHVCRYVWCVRPECSEIFFNLLHLYSWFRQALGGVN